jgi:hypothetical protein
VWNNFSQAGVPELPFAFEFRSGRLAFQSGSLGFDLAVEFP